MKENKKQSFKNNRLDNIELSIYNCGWQNCAPSYTWGPGIRDHYLIHLVTVGKGLYCVNDVEFEVTAGDLFFTKPNQKILYTSDTQDPWEYYWVGFNGSNAAKLSQQLPFTNKKPVYKCSYMPQAKELLLSIFNSRGLQIQDELKMIGYLYLFISLLTEEPTKINSIISPLGYEYVQNAIKYIQFNYSHNINVDDIASAVGVSRSHLYRIFIANIGKSPIEYLTDFRMDEACKLLKTSTLSVSEIAYSVGFSDQFYFSRVFKKCKGVSPTRYKL